MEQEILSGIEGLETYICCSHRKRLFLICGKSAYKTRIYEYLNNRESVLFQDFTSNPDWESAEKAAEIFKETACDCIVALGGGSAIDVAKCVKLWVGGDAPLIAIPTTAGAGSEATHFAVVYRDGEKISVADEKCLPDVILFDPTLLGTLPDYHRKSSMLDALCHGMESFWSVKATEESREYATQAVQNVLSNMNAYLNNTLTGNTGMQRAAYLAGKAINSTQTTAGHAMCYKLTTIYGIAHGHAVALCNIALWPYMNERSSTELNETFSKLAKAFGCNSVEEAIKKFHGIVSGIGLSVPIPSQRDYEILVRSVNAERLKNNPIPLNEDELDRLYHQILEE